MHKTIAACAGNYEGGEIIERVQLQIVHYTWCYLQEHHKWYSDLGGNWIGGNYNFAGPQHCTTKCSLSVTLYLSAWNEGTIINLRILVTVTNLYL